MGEESGPADNEYRALIKDAITVMAYDRVEGVPDPENLAHLNPPYQRPQHNATRPYQDVTAALLLDGTVGDKESNWHKYAVRRNKRETIEEDLPNFFNPRERDEEFLEPFYDPEETAEAYIPEVGNPEEEVRAWDGDYKDWFDRTLDRLDMIGYDEPGGLLLDTANTRCVIQERDTYDTDRFLPAEDTGILDWFLPWR